jgi:hypothetical protein
MWLMQVQLSTVQNSGQFVDSSEGKVGRALRNCSLPRVSSSFQFISVRHDLRSFSKISLFHSSFLQVQERSMAADSERAYEAFVSHQMGGGAPPK